MPGTITSAIVPVAGLGTRLLPSTRSQPKEMLPIVDRPVVQFVVEELVRSGISRILFVTGRRKRAIEDHFDASPELGTDPLIDPRTGLQLFYTRQATPAGLGDAIRYGAGFDPGAGVVVALGDTIIEQRADRAPLLTRMIDAYAGGDLDAVLAVHSVADADVSRYGIVVGVEQDGGTIEVSEVVEKPRADQVRSRVAVSARYVIGPAVFQALREIGPDESGEVQIADAFTRVLAAGGRILAVPLADGERRHDIGSIEGYAGVFLRYALRDPRMGAALRAQAAQLLRGDD